MQNLVYKYNHCVFQRDGFVKMLNQTSDFLMPSHSHIACIITVILRITGWLRICFTKKFGSVSFTGSGDPDRSSDFG